MQALQSHDSVGDNHFNETTRFGLSPAEFRRNAASRGLSMILPFAVIKTDLF